MVVTCITVGVIVIGDRKSKKYSARKRRFA